MALFVLMFCESDMNCDRGRESWQQDGIFCCDHSVTGSPAIVMACTQYREYVVGVRRHCFPGSSVIYCVEWKSD